MTEERKQELRRLIEEAMQGLKAGNGSAFLPINTYQAYLRQRQKFYWAFFKPYIARESIKSKLLDFIRTEFAPFIREDRILSASFFLEGGPSAGFPLEKLLAQLLKIAIAKGPQQAVSDFDRCTKDRSGSFQYIALLEGIKLKTRVQVFDGIQLIPLPNSTSELPHYLPDSSVTSVSPSFFLSKTLLMIHYSVSPIFQNLSKQQQYKSITNKHSVRFRWRSITKTIRV